jgi:hypothetical protein
MNRSRQEFHRFIFQDIYSWAGEPRSVPLAKPGSMFPLPDHIESYVTNVLDQIAGEKHLSGLSRDQFAERLIHYYAEINAVHPFREATGAHSAPFYASSPWMLAIPSLGSTWTRKRLSSLRGAASRAMTCRCESWSRRFSIYPTAEWQSCDGIVQTSIS